MLFALVAAAIASWPAAADAASFTAAIDRAAAAPQQPFVYEVTLTLSNEEHENFRPPDFRGLQVVQAPGAPNTTMSVQMGGGTTVMQNTLTWVFQLALPAGAKGTVTIAPARVRVGGRELATNSVAVRVGAPGAAPSPSQRSRAAGRDVSARACSATSTTSSRGAQTSSAGAAFIRAVADKHRVFVGEQVTVTWYLYLTEPQNNLQPHGAAAHRRLLVGGRPVDESAGAARVHGARCRAGSATRWRRCCRRRCSRSRRAS